MSYSPLAPIHVPGGRKLEPLCVLALPATIVAIARDPAPAPPVGVWMLNRDTDETGAWEGPPVDSGPYHGVLIDDVFVLGGVLPTEAVGVRVGEPGGAVLEASEGRGAWLIALPVAVLPLWSNRSWRPGVDLQWLDADGHALDYNVPPTYEYRPEAWPRSKR